MIPILFLARSCDAGTKRITTQESKPNKSSLPTQGKTYTVAQSAAGARSLADQAAVETTVRFDNREGALEMATSGKMAFVNKGEKVLVLDFDVSFSHGTWVQVRIIDGLARGTMWIPVDSIEGF